MSKKHDEQTEFTVSEETIAATQRCKKDFSCLNGKREDLCPVESCINGEVHFIKCLNKEACPYQGTFGDGAVCYCPTRKELFNKYGK
jgi:hypothetical protein